MDAETAGFKVAVEGTTATVVLKEPYETARSEIAPYQAWTDNGDGKVTLNVEVVPGLYYAADSAATMSVAERRTPCVWRRRAMRLSRRSRRGRRGSTGAG